MQSSMRRYRFLSCLVLLAPGCAADSAMEPQALPPSLSSGGPGGCFPLYVTSGILQPINADNSSRFQLGRTIPVKIRIADCATGAAVNTATPTISLALVDVADGAVNELISSSAADEGTTMRSAGDGQYIFNLSTKRSQFNAGEDLVPGTYRLTISGEFADVVVEFAIRQ